MYYYSFHIGDYLSATAHLSNAEDLTYRRLLDMYYDTELPIPDDIHKVARKIRMDASVVCDVLNEMFYKQEGCWVNARCEAEIKGYQQLLVKNTANGKKGGRPKKPTENPNETQTKPIANPNETQTEPKHKATSNHEPVTSNHIKYHDADASLSTAALIDCPHQEILKLFKQQLPELRQPRVWEGNRRTLLKNRWQQASKPSVYSADGYKTKEDGLEWWETFFDYIAKNTKLTTGFDNKGHTWKPDLEWLTKPANFAKIIDGKYGK
jgi:uncharacterized protein YdaU (DUF1376 family)